MSLMNKLLSNLEKCEDICRMSMVVRTLNGEKNFYGCKRLTCDKCREQANVMLDEWRKELNNNGWIPVEERLPEDSYEVLMCVELSPDVTCVTVGICMYYDNDVEPQEWVTTTGEKLEKAYEAFIGSHQTAYSQPKVIAWQPKLKPFKRGK